MINYEGINYDLNNLLQFDILKKLIEAIAMNQKAMNDKLNGIIDKGGITYDDHVAEGDMDNDDGITEADIDGKTMLKRIIRVERRMNEVKMLDKQIKTIDKKTDANKEAIDDSLIRNEKVNKNLGEEINLLKKTIDEMNNKLGNDMNMYDLLKESSSGGGNNDNGGNVDTTKGLIMNLETKIFKKFTLVDERNKKLEEDKQQTQSDLKDILNQLATLHQNIANINQTTTQITDDLHSEQINRNTQITTLESNLTTNFNTLQSDLSNIESSYSKRLDEIESKLKDILTHSIQKEPEENKPNSITETEQRILRDLNKRIIELERITKALKSSTAIEDLHIEINKLKEDIATRLPKKDIDFIIDRITYLQDAITEIKDTLDTEINTTKVHGNDITFLYKKIENLTSVLVSMDNNYGNIGGGSFKGSMIDLSKYVDVNMFNDEMKKIKKIMGEVDMDLNEFRRNFKEVLPASHSHATVNELKTIEKNIRVMIEEHDIAYIKRFADRMTTEKTMKGIENQVKIINETTIKKGEKSEHWMIASKPIAGHKCASCENDIEDLNKNQREYLPWKKYPLRDITDKSYRVSSDLMIDDDL